MNSTPHTHNLRIDMANDSVRVAYGDQNRHYVYTYWPFWRSRVNRVAARMIRRHDRQSLKAGERVAVEAALKKKLQMTESSGVWGRDVLAGVPCPPPPVVLDMRGANLYRLTGTAFENPYFSSVAEAEKYCAEHGVTITERVGV